MEIFRRTTHLDFIGTKRVPILISIVLSAVTVVSLFMSGLNMGLDFTGGTLVEISYEQPADVTQVRKTLSDGGFGDATVQRFGTTRDLMVRLPVRGADKDSAGTSQELVTALRSVLGEREIESRPGQAQQCVRQGSSVQTPCALQVRRVEFVGPQVGRELVEKGGLALLFSTIGILIYVIIRFEWRFAVGAIVASVHDVMLVFGFFSVTQMEFSLTVLAAILAVLGYSLNDTVVVLDRIRENFRKMRKNTVVEIMNASLNQTLARTVITSGTTLIAVLSLFF
jgi:preprotein translocase subunit SecF